MGEGFPFSPDPTQVQSLACLNIIQTWAVQFVTPSHKWPFTFKLIAIKIGEGNGSPLQYSCLENFRNGGAWWAGVHRVAQSRTRLKRLSSSISSSNKNSVSQWQQPYSKAQQPYVFSGYHIGQCRLQNISAIRESSLSQTLQELGGYHSFINNLANNLDLCWPFIEQSLCARNCSLNELSLILTRKDLGSERFKQFSRLTKYSS